MGYPEEAPLQVDLRYCEFDNALDRLLLTMMETSIKYGLALRVNTAPGNRGKISTRS